MKVVMQVVTQVQINTKKKEMALSHTQQYTPEFSCAYNNSTG